MWSLIKGKKNHIKHETNTTLLPDEPEEHSAERWALIGASAKGAHKISCQDSHYIKQIDGWSIMVVADGAGSCPKSRLGAKYAAQRIGTLLESLAKSYHVDLPDEKLFEAQIVLRFLKVRSELEFFATKRANASLNDYSTTVIALLVSNEGHILCANIGDGRAGFRTKEGQWQALFAPLKGEYANETHFLTSRNLCRLVQTSIVKASNVDAVVALTDGLENYAWSISYFDERSNRVNQKNEPFPDFFNPLIESLFYGSTDPSNKLSDFLNDNPIIKQEFDDRSLVVAHLGHF